MHSKHFFRGYWTHERFMDVCVYIQKVTYVDEKRSKIKISWHLKQNKDFTLLPGYYQTITINREDYSKWLPL